MRKTFDLLYCYTETFFRSIVSIKNDKEKENALHYLSRTLNGAELNYSPIKKNCLALIFAVKKLKHYLQAHTIYLISRADPLKYLMSKAILSGRLAKWAFLLDFDIIYIP